MTFKDGLVYVLRHCWLWPLHFWLRPMDTIDRVERQGITEVWAGIVGGGILGGVAGTGIWWVTGQLQAIWLLALAIAGAVAGSVAGSVRVTGAFASAGAIGGAGVMAASGVVPVTVAVSFVVAAACAVVGVDSVAVVSVVYVVLIACSGLFFGLYFPFMAFALLIAIGCGLLILILVDYFENNKNFHEETNIVEIVFLLLLFPTLGWANFPQTPTNLVPVWGLAISFSVGLGVVTGVFADHYTVLYKRKVLDLRKFSVASSESLAALWLNAGLLSAAAWWPDIETANLDIKLNQLAGYLYLMPVLTTCLLFWPFLMVLALWKFRVQCAQRHTLDAFKRSLPFQWQSFAYPLPGLYRYLCKLAKVQGTKATFEAIQAVQFGSMQTAEARRAALVLAGRSDTSLPLLGHIALVTNARTLVPFSLTGPAGRSVAVLARESNKEYQQPLYICVADYRFRQTNPSISTKKSSTIDGMTEFEASRRIELPDRLRYAKAELDMTDGFKQGQEFQRFLDTLLTYATGQVDNILSLLELDFIRDMQTEMASLNSHETDAAWLVEGWGMLLQHTAILQKFNRYQYLTSTDARREFLQERIDTLRSQTFNDFSEYWRGIGLELSALWVERLEREITQAREWLRLEIELKQQELTLGTQTLNFTVRNPTRTLAEKLRIVVDPNDSLEWHHREVKRGFLEGSDEARLGLELELQQPGPLRITGQLEAEDVAGNAVTTPFVFQLRVVEAGKAYRTPPYQLYIVGEGLGNDRTFVGREDLLNWLRGLWMQPQGKPAVALVGQRRIGKTSLLNKISRDGLPDTGLLPVLLNVQGVKGDYDFLSSIARDMANQLQLSNPLLNRENPYPEFKNFLLNAKTRLAGKRFLLMLDEADLIPQRSLGEDLPGFLRALMQEPQYPVLLLFCGTHALKALGREYSSILFNTAQFRTVSYMSEAESAQVLRRPAEEWLEFDPVALEEAYRLTQGQPLLLQSIGAKLIDRFNEAVLLGKQRSNFVSLNDLNMAADDIVKQGNAAFENHWQSTDVATHRLLSGLAWATDETDRLQLNISGIESAISEKGLDLPAGEVFKIAECLVEEEILTRSGPTYRYSVPLYRRWVSWRWPPEAVRQESHLN